MHPACDRTPPFPAAPRSYRTDYKVWQGYWDATPPVYFADGESSFAKTLVHAGVECRRNASVLEALSRRRR